MNVTPPWISARTAVLLNGNNTSNTARAAATAALVLRKQLLVNQFRISREACARTEKGEV